MAGPDHRRDHLLADVAVGHIFPRERSDFPPLGETKRRCQLLLMRMFARRGAVVFLHASDPQFLDDAPLAVAARRQALRLAQRIGRVVDIAAFRESVRQSLEIRLPLPAPAPLAHLPCQIGAQLRPGRREPSDIGECELLQLGLIQRRDGASGLSVAVHALFVP